MKGRNVIISGGGTGGHLYPALAVGSKIREREPSFRLIFIGSGRSVEKDIMDRQGVRFIPLRLEGLKGRGWKILRTLFLLPLAFFRSFLLILDLKPVLVVGVGGYSSGPMVLTAALLGKPTLILEQNLFPGLTNRLLLPWVRRAVVSFKNSLPSFKGKGVFLGNPVREEISSVGPRLPGAGFTLLVFGGSQGSRFLNRAATSALPLLRDRADRLRIYHQTGRADREWVQASYERNGFVNAVVSEYFFVMAEIYAQAALVLCRAGATTIAEIIAARRPAILVPFAGAADNHQLWNARELERAGAAEVVTEEEMTPRLLAQKIAFYMDGPERLDHLAKALDSLRTEDAAGKIAEECLILMKENRQER